MCKSLDVAVALLDKSIERAEKENSLEYYMDFAKAHKLLYLGASYIQYKYGLDLFEESITAHNCGPYVEGLEQLTLCCGFDVVREVSSDLKDKVLSLPLSFTRLEILDDILDKFGKYSTGDIVEETKNTVGYKKFAGRYDDHPTIGVEDLRLTGEELAAKYFGESTI